MPIIIPTAAEIDRMNVRQREALTARIPQIRDLIADTITRLERSQRMFPNVADLQAARLRHSDPTREGQQARHLLASMPADPDARQHVIDLIVAIGGTTRPQERAERSTGVGPRQPGGLTPATLPVGETQ
jgi:hypothetical protein